MRTFLIIRRAVVRIHPGPLIGGVAPISARSRRSSQSAVWREVPDRHDSPLSAVVRQAESHRGVTGRPGSHREGVTRSGEP